MIPDPVLALDAMTTTMRTVLVQLPPPPPLSPDSPIAIQEAWRRLAGGAPAAVRALLNVAESSRWTARTATVVGLSHDAYRGGQRASVHAMYDPITWPDEGYPCQLCWSTKRWPWEPMRSCPVTVDVESTYCTKHDQLRGTT